MLIRESYLSLSQKMSALIVDKTGSNADGEVRKLQDIVRKLQVQNQTLLSQNQLADSTDVENSPYVVDANCNTDVLQCSMHQPPLRTGVLREQQLNANNARLTTRTSAEADDDVDNPSGAASQLSHGSVDGSDASQMNTKPQDEDLSLDTVELIDIDGKLSDDEDSWSAFFLHL